MIITDSAVYDSHDADNNAYLCAQTGRSARRPAINRGQGFVEYALVILLVVIVVVVFLTLLAPFITSAFNHVQPAL